ncbi:MAG: Methyl-accepting chemotaxis protein PctB [Syntrophorhabdaceae bacterium PtaU1.Bin034]|nr:MAG: Methyl-accepting chemotaxis protein PctB [Syntrophorhabdaceae bacterium PtaU1.Bin034]
MTLRRKLFFNALVSILGILTIGGVSLYGVGMLKQRINAVTESSTPFQLKTMEASRELHEQAVILLRAAQAGREDELVQLEAEAAKKLDSIKKVVAELADLKAEGDKRSATTGNLSALVRDTVQTTRERIKTEAFASTAADQARLRLADMSKKLNGLESSMKELQAGAVKNLSQSGERMQRIAVRLKDSLQIKDTVQEIQLCIQEIQFATKKNAVAVIKGRLAHTLQNVQNIATQNEGMKAMAASVQDLGRMVLEPRGLAETRLALLAAPQDARLEKEVERLHVQCANKLAAVARAIDESVEDASGFFRAENAAFSRAVRDSETVSRIMALNRELGMTGLSIESLVGASLLLKSVAEIETMNGHLAHRFGQARSISQEINKMLLTLGKRSEQTSLNEVIRSFGEVRDLLLAKEGVLDRLRSVVTARAHTEEIANNLRLMIDEQGVEGSRNITSAQREQAAAVGAVNRVVRIVTGVVVVVSLLVLLGSFAFSRLIQGSVMKPVEALISLAQHFGQGNFGAGMAHRGSDEFGEVAENFDKASANVSRITGDIAQMAAHLAENSQNLTATAERLTVASEDQEEGCRKTTSAVLELSGTNSEIASNAHQTAAHANETKDWAEKGRTAMKVTSGKLAAFAGEVAVQSQKMDMLRKRSDDVRQIVEVIKEISEQTNLLALNASIEAARAGDAGLGFAVVAEHVRQLAKRVSQSAGEIDNVISSTLGDVKESAPLTEAQMTSINEILSHVSETERAMDRILDSAEGVSGAVHVVATACREQSQASHVIAEAMEGTLRITKELAEQARKLEGQAGGLMQLAAAMDKKLGWFNGSKDKRLATAPDPLSLPKPHRVFIQS